MGWRGAEKDEKRGVKIRDILKREQLSSIAKIQLATALIQKVQEGKVSLEQKVIK